MSLRENPLNCKTGKSEEPTLRTWEKQWIYSRLSYFLGKLNKFCCSWLYEIFPTRLLGLHASWKPGSSVRGVTFDHVIEHPGIGAMFSSLHMLHTNKTKIYQRAWRVDMANGLTCQAYWFKPLTEATCQPNSASRSNRFIQSAPKLQYKLLI